LRGGDDCLRLGVIAVKHLTIELSRLWGEGDSLDAADGFIDQPGFFTPEKDHRG
jgi:hypothetical protein